MNFTSCKFSVLANPNSGYTTVLIGNQSSKDQFEQNISQELAKFDFVKNIEFE